MASDKYKMFSNYMHNELGITKEDIREWIKEAVLEIAEKMTKNEFDRFSPEKMVQDIVYSEDYFGSKRFKDSVIQEMANRLLKRISINIK